MRHFLVDDDLSQTEQLAIMDLADGLKAEPYQMRPYAGPRTVAVLFDKPSTRTRISFETAIAELGGNPMIIDARSISTRPRRVDQRHRARARSQRSGDCVAYVGSTRLEEMAAHAGVPVINGLTDKYHPCQVLADLQTIREHKGQRPASPWPMSGRANNMAHSFVLGGSLAGMHVRIGAPMASTPIRTSSSGPKGWPKAPAAAYGCMTKRRKRWSMRMSWPLTPGSPWARNAAIGSRSSCRTR